MKQGKDLMQEILDCHPSEGELVFWWLGQMGFIIRLKDHILMIDGFLDVVPGRLQPLFIRPDELKGIDYILGSHDHNDHIDRNSWKILAKTMPEAKFVVPSVFKQDLCKDLQVSEDRIIGINEGTSFLKTDDLFIRGIASAHETLDQDPDTGEYPYTGFIIEANGIRLYHSGDCVVYDGLESKLKENGPYDIIFLPINGRDARRYRAGCIGNMTYQEAVSLTCNLKPRLTVPGHYEMFDGNTANVFDFTDYLEAKDPSLSFWVGGHATPVRYSK